MKRLIKWVNDNGFTDRALITTVLVFGISIGVSFLSQVLLGNSLGLEDFGRFSSTYAKATIISGVLTLGLDISALKFASAYFQSGRAKEFNRFVAYSVCLVGLVSITFFCLWLVAPRIGLGRIGAFSPSVAIAILFWTMTRLIVSLIRATGQQVLSLVSDRIIRDGVLAIACIAAYIGFENVISLPIAIKALAFGCGLGLLVSSLIFAFGNRPVAMNDVGIAESRAVWVSTSLSLWAANIFELAFARTEVIFLAFYGQAANAGLFAILMAVSNLLVLPVLALNVVFQPRFAGLNGAENRDRLRQEARRYVLAGLPVTLVIGMIVLINPAFFLNLFGAHKIGSDDVWYLVALVALRMILAPFGARAPLLQMNDGHFTLAVIILIGLSFKIMLLAIPNAMQSIVWVITVSIATTLFVQLMIFFSSQQLLNNPKK